MNFFFLNQALQLHANKKETVIWTTSTPYTLRVEISTEISINMLAMLKKRPILLTEMIPRVVH